MQLTPEAPWASDHIYRMLLLCEDDVAAFLLAGQALHPGELRTLAGVLGLDREADNLRALTVDVVCRARDLDNAAQLSLRRFVHTWGKDRRQAAADYHNHVI